MYDGFYYTCDGGSIAIGTPGCITCISNEYGDGRFEVIITDRNEYIDHITGISENRWHFKGAVQGDRITVYRYDCIHNEADAKRYAAVTLSGRYGIFCLANGGDIWLQEWE